MCPPTRKRRFLVPAGGLKALRLLSAALVVAMMFSRPANASNRHVAIIVHPTNALSNVSSDELEEMFLLRRKRWRDGSSIYLIMQEEGSPEKQLVLEAVYHMTSDELKRFWLTKIYRGEMTSFPKTLRSNPSVRAFVSQVPNALGYIDASHVDGRVKVLRIDGKLPGMEGYPLTGPVR